MGCDIHIHFEIKLNDKWEHYSQPIIDRNYELFGKMAGVRINDIIPIHSPKGLPKDLSITTKFCADYWGAYGHTHSWFNAMEISHILFFHKHITNDNMVHHKQWGYLFGNTWDFFLVYRNDYPKEIEDIRMVFWFDS